MTRTLSVTSQAPGRKLLIATSTAEEGMDVPSCEFVVRYNAAATGIQLLQSRGRARQKVSEFLVILQVGLCVERGEEGLGSGGGWALWGGGMGVGPCALGGSGQRHRNADGRGQGGVMRATRLLATSWLRSS